MKFKRILRLFLDCCTDTITLFNFKGFLNLFA
jgi:hypothetical protein